MILLIPAQLSKGFWLMITANKKKNTEKKIKNKNELPKKTKITSKLINQRNVDVVINSKESIVTEEFETNTKKKTKNETHNQIDQEVVLRYIMDHGWACDSDYSVRSFFLSKDVLNRIKGVDAEFFVNQSLITALTEAYGKHLRIQELKDQYWIFGVGEYPFKKDSKSKEKLLTKIEEEGICQVTPKKSSKHKKEVIS